MFENLRRVRVLFGRHVPGLFEQRQIDERRRVALGARIPIPVPGPSKITALLDDAYAIDSGIFQRCTRDEAGESASDEHHLHFVEERFACDGLDVGIVDIVGELPFDFDVLIVAVSAQPLIAFGHVLVVDCIQIDVSDWSAGHWLVGCRHIDSLTVDDRSAAGERSLESNVTPSGDGCQTLSMSDQGVILRARTFLTMEPGYPNVEAVAIRGKRIVAVGSLESVREAVGDSHTIDDAHLDHTVLPGLIDQHLHPLLGATTLATEVVATEDWTLPDRTYPAASSPEEYFDRLRSADSPLEDPNEWLLSWGYHESWHGHLDRDLLDRVSMTRPIGIWQRSCHEWYINSAAIGLLELTEGSLAGQGPASSQLHLTAGHFWEAGFFDLVMPKVGPCFSPANI